MVQYQVLYSITASGKTAILMQGDLSLQLKVVMLLLEYGKKLTPFRWDLTTAHVSALSSPAIAEKIAETILFSTGLVMYAVSFPLRDGERHKHTILLRIVPVRIPHVFTKPNQPAASNSCVV